MTAIEVTYALDFPITGRPAEVLLSQNQRLHWAKKAKKTKFWREYGATVARSAINLSDLKPLQRARIVAVFTWPTLNKRDVGNWAPTVKALVDGIVSDAGLLPGDDDKHLEGPDLRRNLERGPASIRLLITELPAVGS